MSGGVRVLGALKDFQFHRRLSTLTLTGSTSWANVPSIPTLSVVAAVGDVLEAEVQLNVDSAASAVWLDAVTEVSGTATNSFATGGAALTGTGGDGVRGWVIPASVSDRLSGPAYYTVQAADIVSGLCTVRFRYHTSVATDRVIYGAADAGSFFSVKNLGVAGGWAAVDSPVWTSYTPTLIQSGTVTATVTRARYVRIGSGPGSTVIVAARLAVTGSGTGGNVVTISLPVTAAYAGIHGGAGIIYDASTGFTYAGLAKTRTTTTASLVPCNTTSPSDDLGAVSFTAGLASGDVIDFTLTYEAA